jgi:hypothetical protein
MTIVRQSPILLNYFDYNGSSNIKYFFLSQESFIFYMSQRLVLFPNAIGLPFDCQSVTTDTSPSFVAADELLQTYVSNFNFMADKITEQRDAQKLFLQKNSKIKAALVDV